MVQTAILGDALDDSERIIQDLGMRARIAFQKLSASTEQQRTDCLIHMAQNLRDSVPAILKANRLDIEAGETRRYGKAFMDRLYLDSERIEAIAKSVDNVAAQPDPLEEIISSERRPNGLLIQSVRVPLGVLAVVYESRPNVAADAGALAVRSGNAIILRSGGESYHSSREIVSCMRRALEQAEQTADAVQIVPSRERALVGALLKAREHIDLVLPRGGKELIARVTDEAQVPVLAHREGLCHGYIDSSADTEKAKTVVLNAKMRRVGICGAMETLLVHRAFLDKLPVVLEVLINAGCAIRGDETICALDKRIAPASSEDWSTEYLDAVLSVRSVTSLSAALEHIAQYSSGHTELIIAENAERAERFLKAVDSAIVMHNASTQFADGGEFGMGAEIGIATGRLHARGPIGAKQLTINKYIVRGTGQCRS